MTEQQEKNMSVSVIENVNLTQVQNTMQKIQQFQETIQKTLKKGHDYGVIPGTGDKPTLLKPGAEKILMMMGVSSEYEMIERVQDYETGFFAFTVRCILKRNGEIITQGVGHCNTREKKYVNQDPFTLANTCLKMAKKRAQIDAVLTISSLSELFTQDIEDMYGDQNGRQQPRNGGGSSNGNNATEAQRKKIYALSKQLNISEDGMKQYISQHYGKNSSTELTKTEASELINYLSSLEGGDQDNAV